MKEKLIEKVISLMDPIGVYGLGPLDEYKDIAIEVVALLTKKDYEFLRQYLTNQYPSEKDIDFAKVDLVMDILIELSH